MKRIFFFSGSNTFLISFILGENFSLKTDGSQTIASVTQAMKEEVKDNKQEPSIDVKDVGEINPETVTPAKKEAAPAPKAAAPKKEAAPKVQPKVAAAEAPKAKKASKPSKLSSVFSKSETKKAPNK